MVLGGTAAAQPGPFQAYLLAQTLRWGWRGTLLTALAPLISDGPIIALAVLILAQMPAWFLVLMQIAGGFVLLYLAVKALQACLNSPQTENLQPATDLGESSLFEAALVNALAPGPYVFWATVGGPIFVEGWRQSPGIGLGFIGGFYSTLIGGFVGFITLFAFARRLDPLISRGLGLVSATVLFLFGFYQLWLGATAVLAGSVVSLH